VSVLAYALVVFAAYRMARAIAVDDISLPFRDRLYAFAWSDEEGEIEERESGPVLIPKARAGWRTWIWSLFTCPLCIGFWISAGLYCAWRYWDTEAVRVVIAIFAVAGAQCFLATREDA
jgi:hypothetical protein